MFDHQNVPIFWIYTKIFSWKESTHQKKKNLSYFYIIYVCYIVIYWASLVAQLVKNLPAMWETWVRSLDWEIPWRRERLPIPVFWPREFHGLYGLWGHKESDTTERLSHVI